MRKRKSVEPETTIQPSQLQLLDIPQAARLLAIGRTSVYGLINRGELATVKLGKSLRIELVAIQKCIEQHRQGA